jgi:hypothetical protein
MVLPELSLFCTTWSSHPLATSPIKFPFYVMLDGITDRRSAAAKSFVTIPTSASIDHKVAAEIPA